MKYRLEFEMQGLPKNPNGSHGHWTAAASIRKKWRKGSFAMALSKKQAKPLDKCSVECIRYSSRASDFDNLVASFKPVIDGLIDAGIIVDDNEKCVISRKYRNELTKPGKGKIKVIVDEA